MIRVREFALWALDAGYQVWFAFGKSEVSFSDGLPRNVHENYSFKHGVLERWKWETS